MDTFAFVVALRNIWLAGTTGSMGHTMEPEANGKPRLSLTADCTRCAALCCVALAFDRSLGFGFDKAAGVPCPNLSDKNRCAVYERRASLGLAGCGAYDCLGAGQRVTALFEGQAWRDNEAGQSWRDNEDVARCVFDAFRAMRRVHELTELLRATQTLTLPPEHVEARRRLLGPLEREHWTEESLARFESGDDEARVRTFLRGLASFVGSKRRLPVR